MSLAPINEERVLVVAPTGRDAVLISSMLGNAGFDCHECRSLPELSTEILRGAGMALVAEEALIGVSLESLVRALRSQPPWSDFPLLLMTSPGFESAESGARLLSLFGEDVNASILERPLRVATLISSVRMALRARRRQYEVRDRIEEKARHEQKLLETQKLESLGILAGGIAHDFNNLLTGILGNASLALEIIGQGRPAADMLEQVVAASERAAHLTQQLLAYAGKGRFFVQSLDLSAAVREISQLVHTSIPKNVELRLDLSDSLPSVEADASQVQQIVMNLVINGAEAIPERERGNVTVSTAVENLDRDTLREAFAPGELEPGAYVAIEVRDTGDGMDASTVARIFDPFFTTKFTGRGLGLAAVLGIVRGHRGALRVRSTPGQGTSFKVWFPAASSRNGAAPPVAPRDAATAAPPVTVLVIDDEEIVCQTARAALKRHGCRVLTARDGPDGIAQFSAAPDRINAVLLDLTMPVMNGEEVLRELQQIRPDVKVILSSGYSEVEVARQFSGKGLAGFVQKPYTAAALVDKVLGVVGL